MKFEQIGFLDKVFVRRPYFEASAYRVDRLGEVLKLQAFRNAVWLASPEFYRELEKKGFEFDLLNSRERLTALKFYNRMSFRATPFGAFSAFGLGGWALEGEGGKVEGIDPVLHLLPSVQYELDGLEARPLTGDVLLALNPTLYRFAAGWRYSRYETDAKGKLSFFVYLLAYDEVDELLLGRLADKPSPLARLVDYLRELTDCTDEEAGAHIVRLVDEQVLITEQALSLLRDGVFEGQVSVNYNEGLSLPDLVAGGVRDGKSFYAGLELQASVDLPLHWQQEVLEALQVLDVLAPVPPENNLDRFREAFEQKFGERRVPLLEALDPDLGVPFDEGELSDEHELLKGLEFGQVQQKNDQLTWTPVHRLLVKAWLQNGRRDQYEPVVLTAGDVSGLPGNELPFPPSTSVFCSIAGDKLIFQNIGGATANALTGRFSAFSGDFEGFCRSVAALEEGANPEVLFAEVLQVSHRKVDNINRRRRVYGRVIPLNSFPPEGSILPKDVDVLVRGGEVLLVQRLSGKRVIPRLPTAFNYHHNEMVLFRFLCALQYKSVRANFDFDPEKYFPGLNFYPRMAYGRTVLSLAKWYLDKAETAALTRRPLSISRLHLFCRERGIPARVSMGRGDQQLVFDLSDDEEALFFLESLKEQVEPVIREYIGKAEGRRFNDQYVLSLMNPAAVYAPVQPGAEAVPVVRDFAPGSEWVYLKVYATYQSLEQILLGTLLPWISSNRQRIRQWFFVRYYDTGPHLRVRFRLDAGIVKDFQYGLQSLLAGGEVSAVVQQAYFDTYQREIERYSAGLIEAVEEVFCRGSEFVAERLALMATREEARDSLWPLVHCYRIITVFFDGDWEQVIPLCRWCADAFFREHGGGKKLKRAMDDRFRELRAGLAEAVSGDGIAGMVSPALELALRRLSEAAMESGFNRQQLMADIVHMQVNRFFTSEQRRHEALIWHCLLKMAVTGSKRQAQSEAAVMDGR
ncbi:lantibiotic dehydratase [Mucilaginibacter rubeus]|uniref:Lantibiotic dehydratase n=1 Tax=Mucilaginibacter rubeus TaxID=2027860 RepID=A0A5C1HVP5_9SPHI|nr:lantibiotic dehydratase [Mucilaginibacter rubeus]QEM09141.1 hypothetical protein DEO27_003615 [Mucilaginibacter rubeus]